MCLLCGFTAALFALIGACSRDPASEARSPVAGSADPSAVVAYASLEFRDNRFFLDGVPFTGRAFQDHANGQRQGEMDFVEGRLHGVVREWYEDGTQSTETHFANGERHGANTYWNEDGSILKEQVWEDGTLVSEKKHH